jgi:hypothetical protein
MVDDQKLAPNSPRPADKTDPDQVKVKSPVSVPTSDSGQSSPEAAVRAARSGPTIRELEPSESRPLKTAILVCHGMGQQVQFSTINDVVNALGEAQFKATREQAKLDKKDVSVLLINSNECMLPRADIKLTGPDGRTHEVHLYEAYWAPLTEGKVSMLDVLKFLFSAGWDGLRFARAPNFMRWMFGGWKPLPFTRKTKFFLLIAAMIVCSFTLLGASMIAAFSAKLLEFFSFVTPDPNLINLLISHLFLFVILLLTSAAALGASKWLGAGNAAKNTVAGSRQLAASLKGVNVMSVALLIVATLPVAISLLVHLAYWVWLPPQNRSSFWLSTMAARLMEGGVGAEGTGRWLDVVIIRGVYLLLWGWVLAVFYFAQSFFVRYVGDVAAYISAHKVSKFNELRQEIKETGLKMARAAYEARVRAAGPFEYRNLIVVGHSLGSVLAYDTLNAMINYDLTHGGNLNVVERTKALITLGSPLDKTAFLFRAQLARDDVDVRESLAAAVQPLICDYAYRPKRWINIWSRLDWISGELDYYDDPAATDPADPRYEKTVKNREDLEASFPMIAHTEYWRHSIFGDTLYKEIVEAAVEAGVTKRDPAAKSVESVPVGP